MSIVSRLRQVLRRLRIGAAGVIGQTAWWICQTVLLIVLAVLRLMDRSQVGGSDIARPVPVSQER